MGKQNQDSLKDANVSYDPGKIVASRTKDNLTKHDSSADHGRSSSVNKQQKDFVAAKDYAAILDPVPRPGCRQR